MVICLEQGADLHMAQLMSLPLAVFCFSKIQIGFTFLVPAHLGVCVCVCVSFGSSAARREFTRQRDAFYTPTTHGCNQYTRSHPASRPGLCVVVTSLHGRDAFYSDNSSRDQWLAFLSAYAFVLVTAL